MKVYRFRGIFFWLFDVEWAEAVKMAIEVLEPKVVAQIAAGEVVERPASVVKELMENSLDAGASQITVDVAGGGVRLIRVTDNGLGIPSQEVELAFKRHATSKIATMADLESIATLGFRGEALPSIAAVADVSIITCTREDVAGAYLNLKNGVILEKGQRGCPVGTMVTVRNLFHDFPARLKFLKSFPTENSHIANLVSQYSLAFPEVKFTLSIEGRPLLQTTGNGSLREVLVSVYGLEIAQAMLEIETGDGSETSGGHVTGFVSQPSITRASRNYLSFFVNRRWVQSRMLAYAVEEAYRGLIAEGRHPIAILNIKPPLDEVDVNVHPTKSEVRFLRERDIFAAVQRAVRSTLTKLTPVPQMAVEPAKTLAAGARPVPTLQEMAREQTKSPAVPQSALGKTALFPGSLPILRVLGQLSGIYIVAEGPDGMYLIDQHTAHERVLFERIQAQRQGRGIEVQGLLEPLVVELTPQQEELMKSQKETMAEYGFSLEPFGERSYLLRSVPALLKGQNPAEALKEVIDSIGEGMAKERNERIATSLACHGAVKAGQVLSLEEMRQLIQQLEQTLSPHTCPHGRPTMLHLSSSHLEKEFGRR